MMLELSVPSGNAIAASSIDGTDNEHDAVARDDSRRKSEAALEKFDTWISIMNTTEVESQRSIALMQTQSPRKESLPLQEDPSTNRGTLRGNALLTRVPN